VTAKTQSIDPVCNHQNIALHCLITPYGNDYIINIEYIIAQAWFLMNLIMMRLIKNQTHSEFSGNSQSIAL